jgi:hypothetical protein
VSAGISVDGGQKLSEAFKALVAAANAAMVAGPAARKYGRRTLLARSEKLDDLDEDKPNPLEEIDADADVEESVDDILNISSS